MKVTLHATVVGRLWSGHEASLRVARVLRRDRPLAQELAQILRDCGDFDGVAEVYTGNSYIVATRTSKGKWAGTRTTLNKPLKDFPSVENLVK